MNCIYRESLILVFSLTFLRTKRHSEQRSELSHFKLNDRKHKTTPRRRKNSCVLKLETILYDNESCIHSINAQSLRDSSFPENQT